MIPKRVVLENFLSFGTPVDLTFDAGEPLWVLCGPNGVGKSSVFDAITYALFGCHRGGKGQGMKELVRHGTNSFRIAFEFAFDGRDYRIVRNYGRRPSDKVEKISIRDGDDWSDISLGRLSIREWTERELGLTYEQFTASVLLKQGEADKIITGTGKERLEMLKTILGVEKYETLAEKAKAAARLAKDQQTRLAERLETMPPVREEDLTAAKAQCEAAGANQRQAQEAEAVAGTRVEQARQFEKLERTRLELEGLVAAAEERRNRAADILAGHAKFVKLGAVVPTLRSVVTARDELAKLEPRRKELRERTAVLAEAVAKATLDRDAAKAEADAHEREADRRAAAMKELAASLETDRTLEKTASEVEAIDRKLALLPADLDGSLRLAATEWNAAEAAAKVATEARSSLDALLKQLRKERKDFDSVEIGAVCSRCRQPVGADHAEVERSFLDGEIQRLQAEQTAAKTAETDAATRHETAKVEHARLTAKAGERKTFDASRLALTRHGEVPAVAVVAARIRQAEEQLATRRLAEMEERGQAKNRREDATKFEKARAAGDRDWTAAKAEFDKVDRDHARASTQHETLTGTLPAEWATRSATLRADELSKLVTELDSLKSSNVAEQHRKLQDDAARRGEWDRQLANVRAELDAIPPPSRIPAKQADQLLTAAKTATKSAAAVLDAAEREFEALGLQRERRAGLVAAERAAETATRIAAKLHEKLGPEGLLRDLVRSAEKQIVKFANETVANLSEGDLAIELDDAEDGPDKAFTLKVRRTDSEPIGVNYLSGSQKFRVSVAVALAIGRFATSGTQSKPLDCVIIDEGFGSLDKDGLRCMADELTRLKDKAALKRIVLVSHQEEFVKSFPVGWQLAKGEHGTTATPFRR